MKINLFRKKIQIKKPLWETDFKKWIKEAGQEELNKYLQDSFKKEGQEVDFTKSMWGHSFSVQYHLSELVDYGYGHYGSLVTSKPISKWDVLLMNASSGRVGRYLVLKVDYSRDPKDMFWAYIACIGHKETKN